MAAWLVYWSTLVKMRERERKREREREKRERGEKGTGKKGLIREKCCDVVNPDGGAYELVHDPWEMKEE